MQKMQSMDKPDTILDHYIFDRILGEGNFGVVQKAIKIDTGEEFAVKIIQKDSLKEDDLYALENEVGILTQIDHPNIVKFYEIYDDETSFYMVFELMTGGELFDRIIEKDYYSEKEAAETIKPIADALRYCHEMNIAHRDLKPQNLLYTTPDKNAIIKITDFGLARVMDEKIMFTQCGTPGFIAPEIICGGGYDMMIDYWSLGIILYILLCGYPPFYGDNEEILFGQITKAKFSFPSPHWDTISTEAKDLIKKLLVADPKQRLTSEQISSHPWMKTQNNQRLVDVPAKLIKLNQTIKKFKVKL